MNVDELLGLIDAEVERLTQEITSIYPELGRQTYRYWEGNLKSSAVEQHISNISVKDKEITRLSNLRNDIVAEVARLAKAEGVSQ